MDTFAWDPKTKKSHLPIIWPRDLLPKRRGFENTRIMTYGYNADLFDRHAHSDMRVWSKNLLKALGRLADADKVSSTISQNTISSLLRQLLTYVGLRRMCGSYGNLRLLVRWACCSWGMSPRPPPMDFDWRLSGTLGTCWPARVSEQISFYHQSAIWSNLPWHSTSW